MVATSSFRHIGYNAFFHFIFDVLKLKLRWRYRCCTHRVPGEIKRREVELDPQVSAEETMSREVELGCESWTSFASGCSSTAVQRTLSL